MKTLHVNCLKIALGSIIFMSLSACIIRCDEMWPAEKGNGKVKTETREVTQFNEVEIAGIGELEIKLGEESAVSVTTDENLIPFIDTKVEGHRLILINKRAISPTKGVKFVVTTPMISSIVSSGAATVSAQINNESLSVRQSGVGTIQLLGLTNSLEAEVSGAGNIDAEGMNTKNVKARVSGVGNVTVSVAEKLDAEVSGAGSITYIGDPIVQKTISGVGSISKK